MINTHSESDIVACRHASPDDTRAGRSRAGHVNLIFAAYGQWGLRRACLARGSRVVSVREDARLFSCEGRMKDVKTSVCGNEVLSMGAASLLV